MIINYTFFSLFFLGSPLSLTCEISQTGADGIITDSLISKVCFPFNKRKYMFDPVMFMVCGFNQLLFRMNIVFGS